MRAWRREIQAGTRGQLDQDALWAALHDGNREISGKRKPQFNVCRIFEDVSIVPDLWSTLRGIHSTTFTHWTKSSERRVPLGEARPDWRRVVAKSACQATKT